MRAVGAGAVLLLALALAGCTATAGSAQTPRASGAAQTLTAHGTVATAELNSAYRVTGGGRFVSGTRDMCDLLPGDSIVIEDAKSVAGYTGSTPVPTLVLDAGTIGYATSWPDDVIGTGVSDGAGTYVVNADSAGVPISITGVATVTWHDATNKKDSVDHDALLFTLTPIPRPDYCTTTSE